MNLYKLDQIIELKIENLGSNGEGVGHIDGFTFFVNGALPGEIVSAKVIEAKKRFGRAQLLDVIVSSLDRVIPKCSLFGSCGGCQFMHLSYEKQLESKRQKVVDSLKRIGGLNDIEVFPTKASPSSLYYRNKIQLPVRNGSDGVEIGLFAAHSHDLIEVEKCYIHCSKGQEVFTLLKKILKESGISAYEPFHGFGELRHLLIKTAVHTGEVLVILVTSKKESKYLKPIADKLMSLCSDVKGVIHNVQVLNNNTILGSSYKIIAGQGYITENLCGKLFKISPASFFQVNTEQAELLYNQVVDLAELTGKEIVLDAYCGVGTLSLILSEKSKNVIGVECVPDAILNAKENAALNDIKNAQFHCNQAELFIGKQKNIDVIILNPPRKGCEEGCLQGVIKCKPKRIIYVSCDPATLARDLKYLNSAGYQIKVVQPFDMFPQTSHVETVVKLERA